MRLFQRLAALAALLTACGGGQLTGQQPPAPDGGPAGSPTSWVVWPVARGLVTAFELDANAGRGKQLGVATTDAAGGFDLHLLAPSTAPILLVVSTGSFTEPATGTPINVTGNELTALLSSKVRVNGDALTGVLVSPLSHLTARLAAFYVNSAHLGVDDALAQAGTQLESHFGGIGWRTVGVPPDLTDASSSGLVQVNDQTKAALMLAGFSQEARNLATAKGLTPGGPLNSLSLLTALAEDLAADGFFDGAGAGGARLTVPAGAPNGYALDGQTVRATLAQGVTTFLGNQRNLSHIATADAQGLVTAIGTDSNPKLFRDSSNTIDLAPPSITFVQPAANASLQGSVTVEAVATDNVATSGFTFTAPAALAGIQATTEAGGKVLRLKGTLDVSALADGQLTISAQATDSSSNTATQSLVVRVANHGPVVNVTSPSEGAVIKGSVNIAATATSQSGVAITKLELRGPLAGAGADQLPAAEQLLAAWDTTQVAEGPASFILHAEDATGASTDKTVHVIVDNVPFGVFHVALSAGAPLQGATVQIVAIDNATGLPLTSVGASGVLGSGNPTDPAGLVAVTLNTENYSGPVQVVASGPTLSYVDPSDGSTAIHVPTSFQFTSYLGHYRTGDAATLPLSLWTTLADTEVLAYVRGNHRTSAVPHTLTDALAFGDGLFSGHIASTAWNLRTIFPVSLTTTAQSLRDVAFAAIPDVALNLLARDVARRANLTPGQVVTAVTLVQLLEQDLLSDGQFDGKGQGGAQLQTAGNPPQQPDSNFLRFYLAVALDEFVQGTQNKTGLTRTDLQNAAIYSTIVNDTSALFGAAPPPLAFNPPSITFGSPIDSSAVRGSITVAASAAGTSPLSSFTFTAPAALTSVQPTLNLTGHTGSLTAQLDTGSMADGPLTITAVAIDSFGTSSQQSLHLTVANHGPLISVNAPQDGSTVKGAVQLSAHATAAVQGATITKLNVTSVVPGLGANQLSVADTYLATWDTTKALEGPNRLVFHAEDSLGGVADTVVTVTVDNVPFGVFNVSASAGAPVKGATVQVLALDPATGQVNTSIGANGVLGAGGPTDASGFYKLTLNVENYQGPVQVVAAGAGLTYTDPTDGSTSISFPTTGQLSSIVATYRTGDVATVPVSLWTTLADAEAIAYAKGHHRAAAAAHTLADSLAFGDPLFSRHVIATPSWALRTTQPSSLTTAPQTLADVVYAAIPDVAMNQLARDLSVKAGVTPGNVITAPALLQLFLQDLAADGQLDGKGPGGSQIQTAGSPAQLLDANTLRFYLAVALNEFAQSAQNKTGLAPRDFQNAGIYSSLVNDSSPLFGSQAPLPFSPPTVTWVSPAASGTGVHGRTVQLTVTAASSNQLASFAFTAPAAITATSASFSADHTSATLSTTWDVSAVPDGDVTLTVTATDQFSNATTQSLVAHVANHGPDISVNSPNDGSVVKGTVAVSASASPHAGDTVTKLIVQTTLPGLAADQLPAADQLLQSWDTTKAPEGLAAITLYAEDNYGASTTKTVTVTVDNVPFGIFHLALSAGAPIAGANCQVSAVSNATGLVDTSVGPAAGVLGSGGPTDAGGLYKLTLNVENYAGPVQVSCAGSALAFTDPSDGSTSIGVPNTFRFTSFLGHYVTGQEVTVPLSLWTTLADTEALAYVQGSHRAAPGAHLLSDALAYGDPLFSGHVGASSASAWDLRSTVPVSLTTSQQILRDVVYAAIPDVGLNRLARDLAAKATVGAGQISAVTLAQILEQDLAADGQLDGKGPGGAQLSTIGHPAQNLDANTLRFYLAYALDEFVQGPTNLTGLTRSGVQAAGVYDHISNDVSALFGIQAPLPFDNQPPTVSFSANYNAVDGTDENPVSGSGSLVSGTLNLTVTASDPSGVATLGVSMGGAVLAPVAGSTPPTKLLFTIDTMAFPDGILSFTAAAADVYGNAGQTAFTVKVANTPPQIRYASDPAKCFAAGAYFNSSVPVDVSAVDANGIAIFSMSGLAGFNNLSGVATRVAGSWTLPAGQADGPVTASFYVCNVVHVCNASSRSFNVDRTAPTLSFVAQPPASTKNSSLNVQVRGSDAGSGVAAVRATDGSNKTITATGPVAGVYTLSNIALPSDGASYTVPIWAVDNAGNSSQGAAAQLSFTIVRDTAGPTFSAPLSPATCSDESAMTIQTSSPGVPVMPVQYTLPAKTATAGQTIKKAATRLGWAQQGMAQPSVSELLGSNPNNWPYLAYSITSPSGVASATFSVTIDTGTTAYTGTLWSNGTGTFALPLTADTIPGLLALAPSGVPAKLHVSLQASSSSGATTNSSTIDQNFQVVGPPLVWAEDAAIQNASFDASSTYRHHLGDGSYASMFTGSTSVKLVRYIVRNPANLPVALRVSGSGSWAASETWALGVRALPNYLPAGEYTGPDGSALSNPLWFDRLSGTCFGNSYTCTVQQYPAHDTTTDPRTTYYCAARPAPSSHSLAAENDAAAASALSVFANPQPNGGETAVPSGTSDGYLLVPAASGSQPGAVVFYVTRPAAPTRATALVYQDLDSDSGSSPKYEFWLSDFWPARTQSFQQCGTDQNGDAVYADAYAAQRAVQYLTKAQDTLAGSFSLTTAGLNVGATATIGATTAVAAGVSFSRSVDH